MSEDWNDPPLWEPVNPWWVGVLVLLVCAAILVGARWLLYGS